MSTKDRGADDGDQPTEAHAAVTAELAKLEALLLGHGHATGALMDASERLARAARTASGHALPAAAPIAPAGGKATEPAQQTPRTGVRRVDGDAARAAAELTERFAALRGQKR